MGEQRSDRVLTRDEATSCAAILIFLVLGILTGFGLYGSWQSASLGAAIGIVTGWILTVVAFAIRVAIRKRNEETTP